MSPYRTPAVLVLNTRRTGAARLRRRAFRAWITVLAWWRGPTVRCCDYIQETTWTTRLGAISRLTLGDELGVPRRGRPLTPAPSPATAPGTREG